MNRILMLAAVGCAALAGSASAQNVPAPAPMGAGGPVQGVVTGGCGAPGGCAAAPANYGYAQHDSRYGWNPLLRKLAFWKRDTGCGTCGSSGGLLSRLRGLVGSHGCGGGCGGVAAPGAFNPYPNGVPGTLVFPQHPFVRSPRDFFMLDGR